MVATDTVVGIVGAVVLVAVMAGVFVYEYNNTPSEPDDVATLQAHFEEDYLGMSATDDIDGDGIANFEDADLDGDGTNNTDDMDVAVESRMSGTIGPSGGPVSNSLTLEFYVGNGSVHVTSTIGLTTAIPVYSGNFAIQLIDPDGTVVDTASSQPTGSASLTVESNENTEMKAGEWSVVVTNNQAGAGGNVAIAAQVHYPSSVHPDEHA